MRANLDSALRGFLLLHLLATVSCSATAKEYHKKQTEVYSLEGCGPNRYALFCRESNYKLTVANPNTEYVSSVKMKRLYDYMSHSECYTHIKSFLCGALFPKCNQVPFQIIFPCRDVCEEAWSRCKKVLDPYEEPWPVELNCSRFYDTDCIKANKTGLQETLATSISPSAKEPALNVHKGKGVVSGRKAVKKSGKGNRKHHGKAINHGKNVNRAPGGKRLQTRDKKASVHANMKPFWKLFKNTLSDMSERLRALSDAL